MCQNPCFTSQTVNTFALDNSGRISSIGGRGKWLLFSARFSGFGWLEPHCAVFCPSIFSTSSLGCWILSLASPMSLIPPSHCQWLLLLTCCNILGFSSPWSSCYSASCARFSLRGGENFKPLPQWITLFLLSYVPQNE